jgi:NADH:ubiquinone oxidoreductase subunit F (NADH-binding)
MSAMATLRRSAEVRRLLTDRAEPAADLSAHDRLHGPLPWAGGPGPLAQLLSEAGLTGRGGAGFPSVRKLTAVAAGKRAVVVANGAEGEPLSSKDRMLLMTSPHLVLDGLQLVAEATSAAEAYVFVPADLGEYIRSVLAQREGTDRLAVSVHAAPDRFISGEESAVVSALSGGPAIPLDTPRLIVNAGLRGRPTLVHNVETLAQLALAARHGAAWFREVGTAEEPGSFLTTISGGVHRPGVYELGYGTPLGDVLEVAGGPSVSLQAVLIGGYHGAWVPWPVAAEVPVSRAGLARFGASPGAGVIAALPSSTCGLSQTARIVNYLAEQSAGQCGPCLNGLPRLAESFEALVGQPGQRSLIGALAEVRRLAGLVDGRGACKHPDGTVRLVRSALTVFAYDIEAHRAGQCVTGSGL